MVLVRSFWLLSLLLLPGCSSSLDAVHYKQFLRDPAHGLVQHAAVGPTTLTCAYLPTDLLLWQDVAEIDSPRRPGAIDSVRASYRGRTYLALSLAHNGAEIESQFLSDQDQYTQAVEYLGSGIAQQVFLRTPAQDSVRAIAGTYSRLYGGTGKSTVLLVFDTSTLNLGQGFTCVLHDTQLGLGTQRFTFAAAALQALPTLDVASTAFHP